MNENTVNIKVKPKRYIKQSIVLQSKENRLIWKNLKAISNKAFFLFNELLSLSCFIFLAASRQSTDKDVIFFSRNGYLVHSRLSQGQNPIMCAKDILIDNTWAELSPSGINRQRTHII